MATTRLSHNLDDSSSLDGTIDSTSSSSTVPGPGAITGRFLKILGEKSLDLVVFVIIRNRLKAIERTVEKSPHIFRNPTGDKEWKRMNDAYNDLSELCRESRSDYYPLSFQRAAAKLIHDITVMTRPGGQTSIDASSVHDTWEDLLVNIQHLLRPQAIPEMARALPPEPPATSEIAEGPPPEPRDRTRKVLLLGAGEVGKSTLMKQIQDATIHDAETYRDAIIKDTIVSLFEIVSGLNPSDLSEVGRNTFEQAKYTFQPILDGHGSSYPIGDTIWLLWHEPAVRRAVRRSRLGMLSEPGFESMDFFLDSAYRIVWSDYKPTHEDIVRCHIRTTGIWETKSLVGEDPWLMIDTGGQRSERKKWIHCFDRDVTAIIFVVALSDYNRTLNEDPSVNRMKESLTLFESIANSRWFTNTLIVLLFNKYDLFVEKLPIVPLEDYFPDYTGGDVDYACRYFKRRFLSVVEDQKKSIVVEYGTAINTGEIRVIFQSIQDEINQNYENMDIL